MASSVVPQIDFSKVGLHVADVGDVSEEDLKRVADEILNALSGSASGMFYAVNHGFTKAEVQQMFSVSEEFFRLPTEVKMKQCRIEGFLQGYVPYCTENLDPSGSLTDLREAFDLTPSEPVCDKWPQDEVPAMKTIYHQFFSRCAELTNRMLLLLNKALGIQDENFLPRIHQKVGMKGNNTTLRCNHYPPIPDNVETNRIRAGAHCDFDSYTLLFQDDKGGLEVDLGDETWVPVQPVPGAIVVNIGVVLQRWSADRLKSARHRVVNPSDDTRRRQSRMSIAFFMNPDEDITLECFDGSDKYPAITFADFFRFKLAETVEAERREQEAE